jgi:hypothetical protein
MKPYKEPKKPIGELVVIRATDIIDYLNLTSLKQTNEINFREKCYSAILEFAEGEPAEMNKGFCEKVYEQILFLLRYLN